MKIFPESITIKISNILRWFIDENIFS